MANDLEDRLIDINYRVNKFIMETGVPVKDYTYDLFVKDYTRKKRIHVIENTPPIEVTPKS